jgi:hypothetical protein
MRIPVPTIALAALSAASLAVAPALATEGTPPGGLEAAPPVSVLKGALNKCHDTTAPRAVYTARNARATTKTHVLRGRASDAQCGLAMVTVSVAKAHGRTCRYLGASGRLGTATACKHDHYLIASGTQKWKLVLPPSAGRGTYLVRVRAVDLSGNVQRPITRRVKVG